MEDEFVHHVGERFPWRHSAVLVDCLSTRAEHDWYAERAAVSPAPMRLAAKPQPRILTAGKDSVLAVCQNETSEPLSRTVPLSHSYILATIFLIVPMLRLVNLSFISFRPRIFENPESRVAPLRHCQ